MTDETIFATALEKADPAERAAFLAEACGDDAARRQCLEGLLLAHACAANFLERPPVAAHDRAPDATQALTGTPDPGVAASRTTGGENGASDDDPQTFLAAPTRPDSLGRIGHYEVIQVLGRGGFGIVFRAFDEMLQRVVALKVMAPQLAATSPARKRFLREARSSAQVRHENVVQVYEVAEQPLPYLAMEFIPGETLQQRLNRVGPLDVPEVLRIGRQIAEGLAAAHATDLIHRDIKPGNVLLEGGQHKAKITDFGLARAADDASISQSGIIAGTPMYMAPEQAQGQTLDQRADLFSLGSVLYQMVSGRPPFRANTTVAALKRVAEDKPRAIREIIPETPQWLCDIIAKLLAKNPADRYQSAREVADVLANCEAQVKAHSKLKDYSRIPRSEPQRSGPRPRFRSRRWAAAAAVLLLPLGGLGITEATGVTDVRGTVIRLFSPEGTKNGKQVVRVSQESVTIPKISAEREDPDRGAAVYLVSNGGAVKVNGQDQEIKVAADLPRGAFQLTGVVLWNAEGNRAAVTDAGLAVFKDCKDITEIKTYRTRLSDTGLANFKDCKNLTFICMEAPEAVTDQGLAAFKDCKNLKFLRLTGVPLTGAGLVHFKDCMNLASVHLYSTLVSDAGLIHLKDCKKLTDLSLLGTQVSDAGLAHLAGLDALTDLDLRETKVTAKGVEGLAKALPKCRIEWDSGVIEPKP